jgi:methyl-accepting chemotaxis protein
VAEGVNLVGQTSAEIAKILGGYDAVSDAVVSIANAADAQSRSVAQVNQAMREIDRTTQQNAAMVEESTAATRQLAGEADRLSSVVSRFSLADEPLPMRLAG